MKTHIIKHPFNSPGERESFSLRELLLQKMHSTCAHSGSLQMKGQGSLTQLLNIKLNLPNNRNCDILSTQTPLETFFSQGPALAAAVTISINECSHHEWHWERNRTVVIHFKWALRHEEHQRAERCWVRDLGIFGRKLSPVQFDAARSNLVLSQSSKAHGWASI